MIACCQEEQLKLFFLTPTQNSLKGFDDHFISSKIKREYTIQMNMLKMLRD